MRASDYHHCHHYHHHYYQSSTATAATATTATISNITTTTGTTMSHVSGNDVGEQMRYSPLLVYKLFLLLGEAWRICS